jgi:hypothetical protein
VRWPEAALAAEQVLAEVALPAAVEQDEQAVRAGEQAEPEVVQQAVRAGE